MFLKAEKEEPRDDGHSHEVNFSKYNKLSSQCIADVPSSEGLILGQAGTLPLPMSISSAIILGPCNCFMKMQLSLRQADSRKTYFILS